MNTNEEIASRNKDRVYSQASNFLKVNGTIPKQADIIALCPGMNRKTVCKYFKQWLAENQLAHSEEEEIDLSEECLKSFANEIRRHRIKAHQEIYDRNKELENANEVLAAERDDQAEKLQSSQIEIGELRKNLGYYQGQFESQGEEIERMKRDIQGVQELVQRYERIAQEAVQRERETADKLAGSLAREQRLQSDLAALEHTSRASQILSNALQREKWFEEAGKMQLEIMQQQHTAASAGKAASKGGSQRQQAT